MRHAFILLAMSCVLHTGCGSMPRSTGRGLTHAVFFSLSEPGDASELVADCSSLAVLPGVTWCTAGTPVDIGRPNVDANYEVGLVIAFRSVADYQEYLNHPAHTRLVDKWRPRWKSVFIRDFGGS